jgi:hypothetical protein
MFGLSRAYDQQVGDYRHSEDRQNDGHDQTKRPRGGHIVLPTIESPDDSLMLSRSRKRDHNSKDYQGRPYPQGRTMIGDRDRLMCYGEFTQEPPEAGDHEAEAHHR